MALVPSTRWTVKDVLSMVRELSKTVDQKKVLVDQGRYFYNAALSEIVTLLNGASDPSYFISETLGISSQYWGLNDDAALTYVNHVTHKIARASGTWTVGSLLFYTLYRKSTTAYIDNAFLRVDSTESSGTVANVTIITGFMTTSTPSADYAPFVHEFKGTANVSSTLASLSYPVDKIVMIYDYVYGQCVPVTLDEYYSIGRSDFSHKSYENDIIWTQTGVNILFRYGSKIVAPGTKTVIYQRQPIYPTLYDDTEYVDLADKWVPLLCKRIYTFLILQTENDIPKNLAQEMQLDYQQISAFAASEITNKLRSVSPRDRQQQ